VHLPDGTLEVRGTAFVVEVRRGVTVAVRVTEGMVWLDLQGLGARTLAAGATWSRVPAAADLARPSPPPAPPEPAPPTAQASTATSTPSPSASAPPTAARSGTVATTAARHAPTAFLDYAAGVRAMARGDYRAAAESFARFEQRARQDERAADAGWLRVVALRRAGDAPGARQAAAQYLRAYPEGAHRDAARRALGE
jgi:TolA-binding protein